MAMLVPRMDQHCLPSPDLPTQHIKNAGHIDEWMITKYLPVYQQCKYWKESTAIHGTRQRYTKRSENGHKRITYGRMVKTKRGFSQGNTWE